MVKCADCGKAVSEDSVRARRKKRSGGAKKVGRDAEWIDYPSPEDSGFGNGKFCYFISCPDSELPIRDYVYQGKPEPHYETKSYNECARCNQRGIKNACNRGISYIVFYTRYRGKKASYKNRYFITGLFPISAWRRTSNRIAYRSDNPIFLSIEDSMELDDRNWLKWFQNDFPKDLKGARNLRYMAKFVKKGSPALKDILSHFDKKASRNRIDEYVKELNE